VKANLPANQSLLLVVDQFEEIFPFRDRMREDGGTEADLFISYLLSAAQEPAARVYVILTMRSDYLGECAKFHGLPEALNDGQYLVPRMTRSQLQEAIEKPLETITGIDGMAVEFHPGLVQKLLNDCDDEPNNLPCCGTVAPAVEQWQRKAPRGDNVPMEKEVGQLGRPTRTGRRFSKSISLERAAADRSCCSAGSRNRGGKREVQRTIGPSGGRKQLATWQNWPRRLKPSCAPLSTTLSSGGCWWCGAPTSSTKWTFPTSACA
jgi:hypothetical protein